MPLAPQSVISHWYKKSSFVYKNFAYCYQNPLWNRPVPKGYPLCPLFWQSMIVGMIFMRLFVYSILLLKALFALSRIPNAFVKTDAFVARITRIKAPPGGALLIVLTALFFGGLGIYGAYLVVSLFYQIHALPALFLPVGLLALLAGCWIYYCETNHRDDRCQVEWYVRVGSLVALALAYWLMPSEFTRVFSGIWEWTSDTASVVWWGTAHACAVAYHWCAALLLSSIKPIGYFVGFAALTSLAGWLVSRVVPMDKIAPPDSANDKAFDEQLHHLSTRFELYADAPWSARQWLEWLKQHDAAEWVKRYLLLDGLSRDSRDFSDLTKEATQAAAPAIAIYREAQRLQREAAARRAAQCKKVTDALARIFKPFSAIVINVRAFVAYVFELIKAKKQGACPYLMFEDAAQKDEKKA